MAMISKSSFTNTFRAASVVFRNLNGGAPSRDALFLHEHLSKIKRFCSYNSHNANYNRE